MLTLARALSILTAAGMAVLTVIALIAGRSGTEVAIYGVTAAILIATTVYTHRRIRAE